MLQNCSVFNALAPPYPSLYCVILVSEDATVSRVIRAKDYRNFVPVRCRHS